ncbi:hypothetical protein BCR32DRAFT_247881 [Anaeromyces robustus]|uniref:Dol-P-Glc:Glc(2)Man(9)GlcNAc(2)-PP-Dol alpha-1,2-glucosyltransferase n=1 Tax=Anaeromyces robustus TaxID=1754192 RepID=A0A1Y1WW06_9FUNG|nr:hypothetical protein BCR32DRAFT_247881 [Anaeromyces robustus]|eukprot:ORX77498.1 hypothetical protein BCR32DRAFT_247881 [Anaeromyces robustus]
MKMIQNNFELPEVVLQTIYEIKENYSILLLNYFFTILLPFLYYSCYKEIYPFVNKIQATLFVIVLSLTNIVFYSPSFEYVNFKNVSQILVLSSYYFSLKNEYTISSLISFFALMVDKSNILWILFIVFSKISYIFYSLNNKKHDMRTKLSSIGEIFKELNFYSLNLKRYQKYMTPVIYPYIIFILLYFIIDYLFKNQFGIFKKKLSKNEGNNTNILDLNYAIYIFAVIAFYSINSLLNLANLKKDMKYFYKRYFSKHIFSIMAMIISLFSLIFAKYM